mmetsp:Transcript_44484/g.49880  ORF Transcript_44484/g.49880 Transcript_44484/m.49880 type:complete len:83 (-) Transcript_44484:146-394(-)
MVYLRIFLGQWCYLYHPLQQKKKLQQKTVYTAVLNIFTKLAKKCIFYVAATSFFFSQCLGIFHCGLVRIAPYRIERTKIWLL